MSFQPPNGGNNGLPPTNGGGGGGGTGDNPQGGAGGNNNRGGGGANPPRKPPSVTSVKGNYDILYQIISLSASESILEVIGQTRSAKTQRNTILTRMRSELWHPGHGTLRGFPFWTSPSPLAKKLLPFLRNVIDHVANPANNAPADVHLRAQEILQGRNRAQQAYDDEQAARAMEAEERQQRNLNAQEEMGLNSRRGLPPPGNVLPGDVNMTASQIIAASGALGGRTGVASRSTTTGSTMGGLAANVSATAGAAAAVAAASRGQSPAFCEYPFCK